MKVAGVVLLGLAPLLMPESAAAQSTQYHQFEWSSELSVLGANSLLGGFTAGVGAILRGESPSRAFVEGLGGGAVVYAGKRIVVQEWFGAGLIGRQVGLVGASMVNNAAAGRGRFDRVVFAFGPVRGYGGLRSRVAWSLDVPAAASAIWGVVDSQRDLDFTESLSAGALVFSAPTGSHALPGTIFYWQTPQSPEREAYVLAHERVHVLQFDQSFLLWGDPLESQIARAIPLLRAPLEYLEFNLAGIGGAMLFVVLARPQHDEQPWEMEATYLGRSR